jgi:hypothetical protein
MTARQALRRVAKAPSFVNPFVGKRGRWYRIDAETMRAIRRAARSIAKG